MFYAVTFLFTSTNKHLSVWITTWLVVNTWSVRHLWFNKSGNCSIFTEVKNNSVLSCYITSLAQSDGPRCQSCGCLFMKFGETDFEKQKRIMVIFVQGNFAHYVIPKATASDFIFGQIYVELKDWNNSCWFHYHPQPSWGKVIFSQASVTLLTGGVSGPGGVPAPGGALVGTPPDGHCCGRYASYWNVFLF